jgi:hypothetical protein
MEKDTIMPDNKARNFPETLKTTRDAYQGLVFFLAGL